MVLAELAEAPKNFGKALIVGMLWLLKVVVFTIIPYVVLIASAVLKLTDVLTFGTLRRLAEAALEREAISATDARWHPLQRGRLAGEEREGRGEVEMEQDLAWTELILSLSHEDGPAAMMSFARDTLADMEPMYQEDVRCNEARMRGWRELLRRVTAQGCPPGSTHVWLRRYDGAHCDLDVPFAAVHQSAQAGDGLDAVCVAGVNAEGANAEGANSEGAALAEGKLSLWKVEEAAPSAAQTSEKEVTSRPSKRHTEMCRHWLAGGCKLKRCRFAHGADQLRPHPLEDQPDLSTG
eukprot:TRINITY_DN2265_c0_g1_i2.p1 TRINITY_DN2265_c0_g1~~TRINITY_DN2265_c0_g1_i2.p1  ORF type:complete len:294 (+),score=25.08 TRINITY_DN2265_c0_g1_i2:78-959(+)